MKKIKLYIIPFFVIFSFTANAQEALRGLQVNPQIQNLNKNDKNSRAKESKAPYELPFFDDFAKSIGFPDESMWANNYVFINQSYAYQPITIGAATFDAIDGNGLIYANAGTYPFGADTLTSASINLSYPGDNTIYLSFYYQPGGLGDTPDLKDSLILEFYSADSSRWYKKWQVVFNANDSILNEKHFYNNDTVAVAIKGDTITDLKRTFNRVFIPINEGQFLTDTFQFRFRNYASLSPGSSVESQASNADHWNIDYVYLDKGRSVNDTIYNDYALVEPAKSLLKNYEAIPWPHYERASAYEITDLIQVVYRNLYSALTEYEKWLKVNDIMGPTGVFLDKLGTIQTINYMQVDTQTANLTYNFPISLYEDSALFEIKLYTDSKDEGINLRWNDTTTYYQKFFNYYAYDDGTAENGYGIVGEGTERAMVAMRFNTYKEDTLRGVQFYFNRVLDDANQQTFRLHVWKDANGKPGNIIYTKENLTPENADNLNEFVTYKLDTALVIKGNFFIGWQKSNSPEMLNVGFDVNRINNDKLYYNYSGEWVKSQLEGTIMIRPIFGKKLNLATGKNSPSPIEKISYNIYPNPAHDILYINMGHQNSVEYRCTVFDIYGRVYMDEPQQASHIDVSNLSAGVYFIRISKPNGVNSTKKFIIVR